MTLKKKKISSHAQNAYDEVIVYLENYYCYYYY